jgi:hypothetical protein
MSNPDYDEKDGGVGLDEGDDQHLDGGAYDDGEDEDAYDPSQPLPASKFFSGGGQRKDEEEKFNDEQFGQFDQHDGGGGGGDGGSSNGGGGGGAPRQPDIDALSAADSLPAFANNDVRVLDASVKAKERLLQKFIDEEEENKERVLVMSEHLKNVKQERLHSQQLLDAKDRDIQTELHLKQLAEREAGQDIAWTHACGSCMST